MRPIVRGDARRRVPPLLTVFFSSALCSFLTSPASISSGSELGRVPFLSLGFNAITRPPSPSVNPALEGSLGTQL
uniref:Secreted protein n=1 Tax=Bursaphelenchus xylophilus TaxID=6326 RepID=A0A1I7SU72_BURXY